MSETGAENSLLVTSSRSNEDEKPEEETGNVVMNDCPPISQNTEILPYKATSTWATPELKTPA